MDNLINLCYPGFHHWVGLPSIGVKASPLAPLDHWNIT